MTGVELIAQERQRQVERERWDALHDAKHLNGELARAAACYAVYDVRWRKKGKRGNLKKAIWPTWWTSHWWKPKDRIRNLVRAGALIAAEIDRIQRAEGAKENNRADL